MENVLAILLAGGAGERLYPLTHDTAKPAVPFGGAYRIIDFTLSNCINSDLRRILVLTQYKSLDLIRHLRDEGRTIVLVSHNMRDVVAVANRVAILKNGDKVIDRPIGCVSADELGHMVMTGVDVAA